MSDVCTCGHCGDDFTLSNAPVDRCTNERCVSFGKPSCPECSAKVRNALAVEKAPPAVWRDRLYQRRKV